MIKVLIADDDSGMRLVLRKIVNKFDAFQVIGEVEDGISALKYFEEENPDVVFLDIEMPEISGIECSKKIFDINPKTIIIFATAHEEFMSEAFELYAFDYLLKPFNIERIKKTLNRIIEIKNQVQESIISKPVYNHKNIDKLIIKNKDGISFIDISSIILVQREERNTVIYTNNNRYITSEGLGNIEDRLEKTVFYRSHKSYIVNLSKISKIYPYGRWTYIVKFEDIDKDALITHKKYAELESIFL